MPQGADLSLGVLFTGRVHQSFTQAANNLRNVLNGLSQTMTGVNSAAQAATQAAQKTANAYNFTGKQIGKVQGGFQRLTAALKVTAAYGLAGTFLFGVINGLKKGVEEIANFDQALKNLQAITGATNPQIAALRDVILEVAANTKYSAVEVADAAVTLGQAGFSASESLDVLKAVANLATGTLSSMKTTSDLLTTSLRAFGENASQAGRYADIFASAVNKSKLDIDKLRISFNYLGPIAHQVGLNLENTAAGAMLLANAGLRGSTIGTGFRRVLQLLVDPSKKLKVLFASTGADLNKLNPAVSSMSTVVEELSKILGKSVDPAERARRAFELFGLRGSTAAAVLGQAGKEGFEAMLAEVYKVGTASKMAEKQMEGLAVMGKNLKDRMVNLAIAIGEGGVADAFRLVLPILREFVSWLTRLANTTVGRFVIALTTLTAVLALSRLAIRYLIVEFIALAASMSVTQVQTFISANGLLAASFTAVGRAVKSLYLILKTNPWFLIATAISTAVVALYTYKRSQREIIPNLQKEGVALDKTVGKLEEYKDRLDKVKEGSIEYKATLQRLAEEFPELAGHIDVVNGKWLGHTEVLDTVLNKYKALRLQNLADVFSEQADRIQSLTRNIQAYQVLITKNAREKSFVRRYTDEIIKFKKELSDLQGQQEATFEKIGSLFLNMGLTTSASFEEIRNKVIDTFGLGVKEASKLAANIQVYYDKIRLLRQRDKGQEEVDFLSREAMLAAYGDRWLDLYRKIDEARQADLLETIFDMQKKMDKIEETAQTQGWTEEQLQAKLQKLNEETYQNFVENETAKEKRARRTAQEIKKAYLESTKEVQEAEISAAQSKAADLRASVKANVTEASTRAKLLKTIEETLNNDVLKIKEKYTRKSEDLINDLRQFQLKSANESVESEIQAANDSYTNLKRRIEDEVLDIEQKNKLLLELEDSYQKDIDTIKKKWEDKKAGSRKEKILTLEEEYRSGIISIQAYYKELDRLADLNLISERQRAEQRAKIQNNLWNSFREGWRKALSQIPTWSETLYEIGSNLAEKLASNFSSSWFDFIEGSKTAGEAFADFARSTLRWLGELIIKQQIYEALRSSSFGGLFGGSGGGDSGMVDVSEYHTGGKVGPNRPKTRSIDLSMFDFIPKLHKGFNLRKDEFLAVLKNNETVIPAGESGGSASPVQIIVNEAPPGTKVTEDKSIPNIRTFIIDVATTDVLTGGKLDRAIQQAHKLGRATVTR